ncbi:hypothetical protein GBF38_012757 [Nibea albiflora]|uniref:Uncharacterized protein n=1 Tax=Nibea albiflora TaxID=240163 RepID=A0ACB7EJ92_NIBAL|nr:hypothetical protein GBF38_012757 [Nibea albiflora]
MQSGSVCKLEAPRQYQQMTRGVRDPQRPSRGHNAAKTLGSSEEKLAHKKPFNREKNVEESSGRATEEGSLFQDGQTCNRCHMYRTINTNILNNYNER